MERLKGRNLLLQLDEKAKDFLVKRATILLTAPVRCAARWNGSWKIPWRKKFSKANLHEGEPVQVTVEKDKLLFVQTSPAAGALSS